MNRRRLLLGLLTIGACTPRWLNAHTPYRQWVVFRQKHLLIGCHRQQAETYDLAREVTAVLGESLEEASARPARAPHPERLASLLGTGQLYLAIVSAHDARLMRAGTGKFSPYGALPLLAIRDLKSHVLLAHADFPTHHAWLVADALEHADLGSSGEIDKLPYHPGAEAVLQGVPLNKLNTL